MPPRQPPIEGAGCAAPLSLPPTQLTPGPDRQRVVVVPHGGTCAWGEVGVGREDACARAWRRGARRIAGKKRPPPAGPVRPLIFPPPPLRCSHRSWSSSAPSRTRCWGAGEGPWLGRARGGGKARVLVSGYAQGGEKKRVRASERGRACSLATGRGHSSPLLQKKSRPSAPAPHHPHPKPALPHPNPAPLSPPTWHLLPLPAGRRPGHPLPPPPTRRRHPSPNPSPRCPAPPAARLSW